MAVSGSANVTRAFEIPPFHFSPVVLSANERENIGTGERVQTTPVKSISRQAQVSFTEDDLSVLLQFLADVKFVSLDRTIALRLAMNLVRHAIATDTRAES